MSDITTAITTPTDTTQTDTTDRGTGVRQCGRCRLQIPISPDGHPWELRDWWLCPDCAHALVPGQSAGAISQVAGRA